MQSSEVHDIYIIINYQIWLKIVIYESTATLSLVKDAQETVFN